MMTTDEFFDWAEGKKLDYDGVPTSSSNPDLRYQCVDLIKYYLDKKFSIKNFSFTTKSNPHGYAKGLWENFDEYPQLKGKFVKVKNTPDFVPQKGDIVEWRAGDPCGKAGHTALSKGRNISTIRFYSLDQNWGVPYCKTILHSYKGVYGVIRPLQKVTTTALNVRNGAGANYKWLGEIPKGTLVMPSKYENGWAYIPAYGGWVAGNYLD